MGIMERILEGIKQEWKISKKTIPTIIKED
jgi:hypothetical protein